MSNRPYRETSSDANESMEPFKETIKKKILESFNRIKSGATSEEISIESGIDYAQCHKRIADLVNEKRLCNTGITRKNKSGRKAMVRNIVTDKIVSENNPKQIELF